jgi:hypothetical protein
VLGILLPLADWWYSDSCLLEAKHIDTQYLTWFGKSPTSTGEVHTIRDREKIQYTYMEEEDHIHSTQLLALIAALAATAMAAAIAATLFFSSLLFSSQSLSFCCSLLVPIYRLQWQLLLLICQQWWPLTLTHLQQWWLHQQPSLTLW